MNTPLSPLVETSAQHYTADGLNHGLAAGWRSTKATAAEVHGNGQDMNSSAVTESMENPVPVCGATFERDATDAIRGVRRTLSEMLESGRKPILKSRDAQKFFGLDANLSWQIYKLFSAGELLGAAQYIPPAVSMQRIFTAARERGVDAALIRGSEDAFEHFDAFISMHAGDRARFESMTAAMAGGEEAQLADAQQRKALFKAHSHFWGIEVETMYLVNIIGPGREDKNICDGVCLMNMLNFSRLRSNSDTFVAGMVTGNHASGVRRETLDAEAHAKYGAAVIPHFSTKALPLLRTVKDQFGISRIVLAGDAVGLTSGVDLAFGDVIRNWAQLHDGFYIDARSVTVRPTRRLYLEILVHRAISQRFEYTAKIFGHAVIGMSPEKLEHPAWELACREPVTVEKMTAEFRLPDLPRRRELLSYACDYMGWSLKEFDVYRLQIDYPMLDTVTVLRLTQAQK